MPIYKQTTEITNIDDLLSSVERDIEEVYFGDKQVFTVWAEYDGILPATYTANGSVLADYRIYGASGGVGDRTINLVGGFTSTVYGDLIITVRRDGALLLNGKNSQATTFFSTKITLSEGLYAMNNFLEIDNPGASTIRADIRVGSSTGSVIDDNKAIDNGAGVKFNVSSAEAGELFYVIQIAQNYMCDNVIIAPTLTRGITIPIAHVPYGYKVDMSVKSGNLFDVAQTNNGTDYYAGGLHWEIAGQSVALSETSNTIYPQSFLLDSEGNALQLTAGKTYYAKLFVENAPTGSNIYIFLRKKVAGAWSVAHTINTGGLTILAPADVEEWTWLLVAQGDGITYTNTKIRLQVSETPILEYVPYNKTTTPIYIGSSPLEEGEYVDYESGKIYRMSGGALTPTDPPVPLPALPTVDGTNIVDYAGQSVAVPSRFYAKYRKG